MKLKHSKEKVLARIARLDAKVADGRYDKTKGRYPLAPFNSKGDRVIDRAIRLTTKYDIF